MWLAPNMVTLLGFLCILVNVLFLEIFIPDLVGPVCAKAILRVYSNILLRLRGGSTLVSLWDYGCILPWIMSMESRPAGLEVQAALASSSSQSLMPIINRTFILIESLTVPL